MTTTSFIAVCSIGRIDAKITFSIEVLKRSIPLSSKERGYIYTIALGNGIWIPVGARRQSPLAMGSRR